MLIRAGFLVALFGLVAPVRAAQIILDAYAGAGQSNFSRDVGYNSPSLFTAGVGFRLTDVTVPCNGGCKSYSLTNAGLTDTLGTATTGFISSQASVTSDHGGSIVTGSGNGYAGASLEAGTVSVSASGNFLDSYPNPNSGQDGGSGNVFAQFRDVLHFAVAGASASTVTMINISHSVTGSLTGSTGSTDVQNILQFGDASLRQEFLGVLPSQPTRVYSSIFNGWAAYDFGSNTPASVIFHGTYALTGSKIDLHIAATLTAQCGIGANCDYTQGGQFRITGLPSNVTYTSDSGVFLTTPAPVAPTITSVVNAADGSARLSPGALATVTGMNLGASVTASVGGKPAVVSAAGVNQVTIQIPVDAVIGNTSLAITVGGLASAPFAISLDAYAPALFGDARSVISRPGESATVTGTGFGAISTPVTLTVGGQMAAVTSAGLVPGQVGIYQIVFTVPAGLQGTQAVIATVAGRSSNSLSFPLFGISSVVSNASFGSAGVISPGSIVSVFANGLGTNDQSTSVLFNGTAAPLFHVTASQGQIDLLVPYELPVSGTVNVQLRTATGNGLNYPVKMAAATPSLYFLADPAMAGRNNVLAQFNNTAWLALPDSTAAALKIPGNCSAAGVNAASLCGQPALAGDYLVLYTTGLGKATPKGDPNGAQLKTGDVPPADGSVLYQTVSSPVVTVGGMAAAVVFSGIAPGFPGLYQIDFQVPGGVAGDDLPVTVSIGGVVSETRTLAVRAK